MAVTVTFYYIFPSVRTLHAREDKKKTCPHTLHTFGVVFLIIHHDLGTSDGTICTELLSKMTIINGVVQVLDIQVDTLVTTDALTLFLLKLGLEIHLSLSLLLGPCSKQLLTIPFFSTQIIHCLWRNTKYPTCHSLTSSSLSPSGQLR